MRAVQLISWACPNGVRAGTYGSSAPGKVGITRLCQRRKLFGKAVSDNPDYRSEAKVKKSGEIGAPLFFIRSRTVSTAGSPKAMTNPLRRLSPVGQRCSMSGSLFVVFGLVLFGKES